MTELFKGKIERYGYSGEGITLLNGKVVFLPYTLKDEIVSFNLIQNHSSFAKGRKVEVIEKSELREVPPCPYYEKCGGCSYQHTTYENELNIKKELLLSQLKKINVKCEPDIVKSANQFGYRNKIHLFVCKNGLALKELASNNLCPINRCLLVSDEMNSAIAKISKFITIQKLQEYYREVIIREEGNSRGIIFILKKASNINYQGLFLLLGKNYSIFEQKDNKIIHKIGEKYIFAEEFGLKCNFSPNSFHQVNRYVGSEMYNYVLTQISGKSVANCYSGAGVLSAIIAKQKKRTYGIELGQSEHQDAERLKQDNNLFYLTNIQGDCKKILPELAEIDCVIVDPPRSGLDIEVVQTLNRQKVKLIYISCNSATLTRDLSRLTNFKVEKVMLFDMFSRTSEYEVVVTLKSLTK